MLLTVPAYSNQLSALGSQFERLLRVPGSSEVPTATIRLISALTAQACDIGVNPDATNNTRVGRSKAAVDLVNLWANVGITEALDDIQVSNNFACVC